MLAAMKIALALAAVLLAAAVPAAAQETPPGPDATATVTAFAPGQVWTLKDTALDGTRLIVDKLETVDGQSVVHVSLTGVPVPGAAPMTMAHLPFSEDAVRESVDRLVQSNGQPFPGFADGYAQWQQAHGGVFTASVSVVIGLIVTAVHAPPPGQSG